MFDRQRARAENIARQLGCDSPGRSLVNALLALVKEDERTDIPRQLPAIKNPPNAERFYAQPETVTRRVTPKPAQTGPEPELTLW